MNLRRFSLFKLLAYLWASPWTLFGVFWGILGLFTGGRLQVVQGVIEFHGGLPAWLLRRAPLVGGAAAITFGHTVLARTLDDLEASPSTSGSTSISTNAGALSSSRRTCSAPSGSYSAVEARIGTIRLRKRRMGRPHDFTAIFSAALRHP